MKRAFLFAVGCSALAYGADARAADKAVCMQAASSAQTLRDEHKLVEARDQLRVCAASGCPAVLQTDCAAWLTEVERALPTVVASAKNEAGTDLVNVKVLVDGQPLLSKLDGQAVAMNPGAHSFHFVDESGATFDNMVMVREGEKDQPIAAVLRVGSGEKTSPEAGASPAGAPSSALRTAGWAVGGAGVLGLVLGSAFGIAALGDKNGHCDANNTCDAGSIGTIKSSALVADVAFAAGGVLLLSGAALVVWAPAPTRTPAGMTLAPTVAARGGGLVLGGRW